MLTTLARPPQNSCPELLPPEKMVELNRERKSIAVDDGESRCVHGGRSGLLTVNCPEGGENRHGGGRGEGRRGKETTRKRTTSSRKKVR